jgi:phosphoglycerate-specific signal transduction histidine kinase
VNELVREVLTLTNREMEKNDVTVQTALSEDPGPYVLGDRAQLEQVFLNIVMNAIEAMHSSIGRRMPGVKTEKTKTGAVSVTIADSGPGIDPDKIAKIFDTSSPRSLTVWVWDYQSVVQSLKPSGDTSGPLLKHRMDQVFTSSCRVTHEYSY